MWNYIKSNWVGVLALILLLVLLYFPYFLHLGRLPMQIWDEARLAVNACEMHLNNNFIVTYFDGEPEMWNTKPPLMIWTQCIMIKVFGISEAAVRLPSALAAFFTALLMVYFSYRYLKSLWFGIISALLITTTYGWIDLHASRTADYDTMLTMFCFIYCFSYFSYLQNGNTKYLHLFFIALILAGLTKGVQAFLFLPGLLLYTVFFTTKFNKLIRNKWVYIDSLILLLIVVGYYFLREQFNPGYLQAVMNNELGGRFLETTEGHYHGFMFYYNHLVDIKIATWYPFIVVGLFMGIFYKDTRLKKLTIYAGILSLTYWLIISVAETKLEWYDLPMYPLLFLVAAIPVHWIFQFLKDSPLISSGFKFNLIPFIFLFFVFLKPYEKITDKVYAPREREEEYYRISFFIKQLIKHPEKNPGYDICYDNLDKAHWLFYYHKLNESGGQKMHQKNYKTLVSGDMVIVPIENEKKYIESNYKYEVLEEYYHIKTYRIL